MDHIRTHLLEILTDYCGKICIIDDSCFEYLLNLFLDSDLKGFEKMEALIEIFPDLGSQEFDSQMLLLQVEELFRIR